MTRRILAAACLALGSPGRAGAAAGATGANVLKVPTGARTQALGGPGTALTGDLSVLFANPSLLAPLPGRSLEVMHQPGVAGMRTEYASYSIPLGGLGIAAGSVLFRTLPQIDNEEAVDAPVSITDGLLMLTFARRVGAAGSSAGFNIKLFNNAIGDLRATSVALDLGASTLSTGANPVRFGVAVQNLGNPIRHEEAGEPLPLALRGGASWSKAFFPHGLTLAADAKVDAEQNVKLAAGAEWMQAGRLFLRGGGGWSRYGGATFAAGGGWRFRSTLLGPEAEYRLDYAWLPFPVLSSFETTHAFSLFVRF